MEYVLDYLGSAEIIYTNSYHGAFWSLLLGREVIIPKSSNPLSSKFYGLLKEFEEKEDCLVFTPPDNYLEECRKITRGFCADVIRFITGIGYV